MSRYIWDMGWPANSGGPGRALRGSGTGLQPSQQRYRDKVRKRQPEINIKHRYIGKKCRN
jgi:hypothetical protein